MTELVEAKQWVKKINMTNEHNMLNQVISLAIHASDGQAG
jgi:hypothetical protein